MQWKMMSSGDLESDAGADIPPAKRARLSEARVGRSTPVPACSSLNFAAEPGKSPRVLVCSLYSCLTLSHFTTHN